MGLLEAAALAVEIPLFYARRGSSLAHAALGGSARFVEMAHYPRRDVSDPQTGNRFYYHAHRHGSGEHGHFHLFRFEPGTPRFVHLAALSLDHRGQPMQWFTTNQWVTGEHWLTAARVARALQQGFELRTHGRMAPVARWLGAMVRLFMADLVALIHARDARLAEIKRQHPRTGLAALRQDRRFDVLSTAPASLTEAVARLSPSLPTQPQETP